ncbi:MAG: 30S ribosomal protein S8 [Thermoplasmata archaeon]
MAMTDPIADMLTRIRNSLTAGQQRLDMPSSRIKADIARILKEEGFIENFKVTEQSPQNTLRIHLRYGPGGEGLITGIERVSRPGRRVYCGRGEIPTVLGGLGISILSTSSGVLSGRESRKRGIGGEVLCQIW